MDCFRTNFNTNSSLTHVWGKLTILRPQVLIRDLDFYAFGVLFEVRDS